MPQMTKEAATEIVVDFLKKQKNTDKIDIAMVEENSEGYVVRGTCPIDMEGHPWAERFTILVDSKGKIKTTDYALL
ncbi:MAG: hypothetical protein QW744_06025 [Candidatus Bathyarchaeia archaeon]